MSDVPAARPDTIPDDEPIPHMAGLVEVQVPPLLPVTVSVVVAAWQTLSVPVMAPGEEFTVIVFVT